MKRFKVLSLAALVAFAACDEGTAPIVAPPVTGTITGVVTIEGAARSGVSVTLSSGAAATTDASGAYSFAGVNAGTYTITISGFPTDATFSTTTKGATITTAGQVATVNFDGAFVRTSAILGSVSAGGSGLAGVRVALTGATTAGANVNTDANGQYAFSGLRAGTYTVTISGFDAGQFTFSTVSSTVTVAVGATQSVGFTGQRIATASITGTVTIEGAAAAGVRATLSTGAVATTSATGAYSFGSLTAGTYTVTISGFPADAQFATLAQTVTITSAGSTVNANFAGTFIRTATLNGLVTVAGAGVGGVTVTLSGAGTATVNTDANGLYSFSALRAGTYTVTISGWNAGLFTFATTSGSVTLATGESASRNFAGAHVATAVISGSLFVDEMAPNGTFDTATEDRLAVAGIQIQAEGGAVNQTITTTTDATGNYSFTGLTAGTYRITILGVTAAPLNAALPGNVAFRAGQATAELRTLAVGGTATVNWPFNISVQRVDARINLTPSLTAAAGAPVTATTIRLYDTYANALANGGTLATGMIGTGTSTATPGVVTFRFNRALDLAPGGGTDNVVFALVSTLPANHALLNSNVMEVRYNPKDSIQAAPDFFRARNQQIVLRVQATPIAPRETVPLVDWFAELRRGALAADTAGAALATAVTNAQGIATFTRATPPSWPDTIWIRLQDNAQIGQIYPFTQIPSGTRATPVGRFLRFIWDGTIPASDTVMMGAERVRWSQAIVSTRVHRERDDSTGVTPLYSSGDNLTLVGSTDVRLFSVPAAGAPVVLGVAVVPGAGDGIVTFPGVATQANYQVRGRTTDANLRMVSDTLVAFTLDGSAQEVFINPLAGTAGNSTFAFKAANNRVEGTVRGTDLATNAQGIRVRVQAGPGNVGSTTDTTVVVAAGGTYATAFRLLEGPYTITVADSVTATGSVWSFLRTLTTTSALVSGTHGEGAAVSNTDARTARRLAQGYGNAAVANFMPDRMDTRILGNVVNDRDGDLTTLDPGEALEGAVVRLFRDGSGTDVTYDTLIAEATTDINGRYSFTNLREGRYAIRWIDGGGNATVLRAIAKDSSVVTTGPAAGTGAQNTRTVGNQTHTATDFLPSWNYNNSSMTASAIGVPDFTFLFRNTTVQGTATTGAAVAVAGMTVSMRRCNVSTGAASPPPAVAPLPAGPGCSSYLGTTINTVTDATGRFIFTGLTEGVYEITPIPNTVGVFTTSTPAQRLYLTVGSGDIETGTFTIS
jgi:hypothetical protein